MYNILCLVVKNYMLCRNKQVLAVKGGGSGVCIGNPGGPRGGSGRAR